MTEAAARAILRHVEFPDYEFHVRELGNPDCPASRKLFLWATYWEPDITTGEMSEQVTRKWNLSQHAVRGELVQTAFKCILTSMEHRAREGFTYRGRRIFGPHFNLDALVEVCDREDGTETRE